MRPIILYREIEKNSPELEAMGRYFFVTRSRLDIQKDDLVIARYSCLPFFREQEEDIHRLGARFINNYLEHRYVADLREWYQDLEGITFKTWFSLEDIRNEEGPFVLKGETNSKRQLWGTHMYAETFQDAVKVYSNLQNDSLIGQQEICIRKYVKLKRLLPYCGYGPPVTKEFRFFFYRGEVLSGGFYWSSHTEEMADAEVYIPQPHEVPAEFLKEVARRVRDKIPFYVVDIAQTEDDQWVVVEMNCGMMSGVSDNSPENIYKNLAAALS